MSTHIPVVAGLVFERGFHEDQSGRLALGSPTSKSRAISSKRVESSTFSIPPYKPLKPGVCSPSGLGSLLLPMSRRARLVVGVPGGCGEVRRIGAVYDPCRRL